jgi:heptosyltransferase-2
MKKEKVLIIKVGYSETLDREISAATSYGDVLRTTVLLHLFKNSHVTWLVDRSALPILADIKEIDRILVLDPLTILQLQMEHFDTVINLEKVPGLCALADSVNAWRRYGFRFDIREGKAEAYDGTQKALHISQHIRNKRNNKRYVQQVLFEMVGRKWNGEGYVFGYKPKGKEIHDIGFNHQAGKKWPTKPWPIQGWRRLEKLLGGDFSISWQQGLDNMEDYFEWIHSCRMIVTNDSFGLHLALSMKKKVVSLFGPTNPAEVHLHDFGVSVTPETNCPFFPCYEETCSYTTHCMTRIAPETVADTIRLLSKRRQSKAA